MIRNHGSAFLALIFLVLATMGAAAGEIPDRHPLNPVFGEQQCPENACCTAQAGCCSANIGHCSQGSTCNCSKSCGNGVASCSCKCDPDGPHAGTSRMTVSAHSNGNTLEDLARHLADGTKVSVEISTAVRKYTGAGQWSGSLDEVLEGIAAAYAVDAFQNEQGKIIFKER